MAFHFAQLNRQEVAGLLRDRKFVLNRLLHCPEEESDKRFYVMQADLPDSVPLE